MPDLVILEFQHLEAAGSDRAVLLWMQDAYTVKAMNRRSHELVAFVRGLAAVAQLSDEERWQRKVDFLANITCDEYKAAKSGDAAGGTWRSVEQAYADAARTFYVSESALYGAQLTDLAEYLKSALESGKTPDLERFAKEAFLSMARISSCATAVRAIEGGKNAQSATKIIVMLQEGVEALHRVGSGFEGAARRVGRDMLDLVQRIGDDPGKYLVLPAAPSQAVSMFDFDPEERAGDDEMDFAM